MEDERENMSELNTDEVEVTEDKGAFEESVQEVETGIDGLKAQVEEMKDKYLRAVAEMDNMKKRQHRHHQEILKYGKEAVLRDFLLVYDAVEKSITSAIELYPDDEHFIKGLRMTEKLLLETLKKHGVEPIKTTNVLFDPNFHEAMMQVKRGDLQPGMVADEIEKGFILNDRVLRPAKVTVAD